jgi:hypothetical protein
VILTKDELIASLEHEIRVLLHLASKVDSAMLDYRPSAKQRSMLELLQYLTIAFPIHLRVIHGGNFDMDTWRNSWRTQEAIAKARNLEQVRESIAGQTALFGELLRPLSEEEFRTPIEMFGHKGSRSLWIIRLVVSHYAAYRMQLFLYLKACGREELNTMNLWGGMDPA